MYRTLGKSRWLLNVGETATLFVHKLWDAPTTSASVGPATEQQQSSFSHRHRSLYSGEPEGMLAMGPE